MLLEDLGILKPYAETRAMNRQGYGALLNLWCRTERNMIDMHIDHGLFIENPPLRYLKVTNGLFNTFCKQEYLQ